MLRRISFPLLRLLSFVLVSFGPSAEADKLRCPLVWVGATSGDKLPEHAVELDKDYLYIIRATDSRNNVVPGIYDTTTGKAIIAVPGPWPIVTPTKKVHNSFEVLTNPHGCKLQWHSPPNFIIFGFRLAVYSDVYRGEFHNIGRYQANYQGRSIWVAGAASDPSPYSFFRQRQMVYALPDERVGITTGYELLSSYSDGFDAIFTDLILGEPDVQNGQLFLGMDIISNQADTTLKQTVTHRSAITEAHWFHESDRKVTTITVTQTSLFVSLKYKLIGLLFTKESTQSGSERSEDYYSRNETEVIVSRTVEVPPYTSVQVCSTVNTANNVQTEYIAKAQFRAPGWTGPEVVQYLHAKYNWTDAVVDSDSARRYISGIYTFTVALETSFIVKPLEDAEGCMQLEKNIRILNQK